MRPDQFRSQRNGSSKHSERANGFTTCSRRREEADQPWANFKESASLPRRLRPLCRPIHYLALRQEIEKHDRSANEDDRSHGRNARAGTGDG